MQAPLDEGSALKHLSDVKYMLHVCLRTYRVFVAFTCLRTFQHHTPPGRTGCGPLPRSGDPLIAPSSAGGSLIFFALLCTLKVSLTQLGMERDSAGSPAVTANTEASDVLGAFESFQQVIHIATMQGAYGQAVVVAGRSLLRFSCNSNPLACRTLWCLQKQTC
jgi:hypothetical protein